MVKIADFELACFQQKLNEMDKKEQEGTPYWMAPEVITFNLEKINNSSVDENINSLKVLSVDYLDKKSKHSDEYKSSSNLQTPYIDHENEDEKKFFNHSPSDLLSGDKKNLIYKEDIIKLDSVQMFESINLVDSQSKEHIKNSIFSFKRALKNSNIQSENNYLYSFGSKQNKNGSDGDIVKLGTPIDVWSLGCTLLECLTGNPPYHDLIHVSYIFS